MEKEKLTDKRYLRYSEGAELYSMSKHTFMKIAAEAKAVIKYGGISLVNVKVFEEYLELFR